MRVIGGDNKRVKIEVMTGSRESSEERERTGKRVSKSCFRV